MLNNDVLDVITSFSNSRLQVFLFKNQERYILKKLIQVRVY